MANQCLGKNQAGGPCGGYVPQDASWCLWHDPAREAEREEWRRRGGANRSNKARARRHLNDQLMSIADLDAVLCSTLVKVASGKLEPAIGSSVATIARTITTIRTAGELERRLAELEQAAGIGPIRRIG